MVDKKLWCSGWEKTMYTEQKKAIWRSLLAILAFHLADTVIAIPFSFGYSFEINASQMEPFNLTLKSIVNT